jgi:uncharacterized phage protein (TIGR01671 family)
MVEMKEIKFRAWDIKNGQWISPEDIPYKFLLNAHLANCGKFELNELSENGLAHNLGTDFELMQYTGLKDKNEKEIYESDICIMRNCSTVSIDRCDGAYECVGKNGEFVSHLWLCGKDELEVIGNIYENPDWNVEIKNERT